MEFRVRPFDLKADCVSLADLHNAYNPEPETPEKIVEWEERFPPDGIRHQVVAENASGRVLAFGEAGRVPWKKPGWFWAWVVTDPVAAGRGLGSALYAEVESWARENGATTIEAEVRDNHGEALAWAQRRGYAHDRHRFESTLDLGTFDDARFAGVVAAAAAGGIRFCTLAGVPGEATERQMYDLYRETFRDVPGFADEPDYPPFDQWRRWSVEGSDAAHDCFVLAFDGDRLAGLSTARIVPATGALYIQYTAVHRDYRGRGLALAIKLAGVEAARRRGLPYVRTNNDSLNAPMLAVNRKMGYVPSPGFYGLLKKFG